MLPQNEILEVSPAADQSKSCLALKPTKSLQSELSGSGGVSYNSRSHSSGPANTWKVANPTEKSGVCSKTALSSVRQLESLSSRSAQFPQSSRCRLSSATNDNILENVKDSGYPDHSNPTSDGEDEGMWFNAEASDLYFTTGIEL